MLIQDRWSQFQPKVLSFSRESSTDTDLIFLVVVDDTEYCTSDLKWSQVLLIGLQSPLIGEKG